MKRLSKLLALALCGVMLLASLTGCGGNANGGSSSDNGGIITVYNSPDEVSGGGDKTPLAAPSDFTFDFDTCAYSFTAPENAEFYYIKIFPVENGEEGNSATLVSDKLTGSGSMSGTLSGALTAGEYIAHLTASASGYSSSETTASGKNTTLTQCTVSAVWEEASNDDAAMGDQQQGSGEEQAAPAGDEQQGAPAGDNAGDAEQAAPAGDEQAPAGDAEQSGDAGSGEEGAPAGDQAGDQAPAGDAEQSGDAGSGEEGAPAGDQAGDQPIGAEVVADVTAKVTITAGDAISESFTLTVEDASGNEVFRDEAAQAGDTVLTAEMLGVEALSKEDDYTVKASVNPVEGYKTPEQPAETKITEQQQGSGSGGDGGGGAMAGWEVEPESVTFAEGAESFEFVIGSVDFLKTTAELVDAQDGAQYTYKLNDGDDAAPFESDMFLNLYSDGTCKVTVSAAGPLAEAEVDGTWVSDGGNITLNFE